MNLLFIEKVILFCLYKIDGERTIYSIYHLLKGKKSSQTLQDAHLFQLLPYFGSYHQITREQLESIIKTLLNQGHIMKKQDSHVLVTEKGLEIVKPFCNQYPILKYLNGWTFQYTEIFWRRLSLLVQVASNLQHGETRYLPIQKDREVQIWLKKFLLTIPVNRSELSEVLLKELIGCFENEPDLDPSSVVIRLTGYNTIGLTDQQAAGVLNIENSFYHYNFISLLHYMISVISTNPECYPILFSMIDNFNEELPLTHSTKSTYNLIQKGYSIEEIAFMRRLKMSTIHDHIVELALNMKNFSIEPYVNENEQAEILAAAKISPSKQLKQIRQYVQHMDYFKIRLVISKFGDSKWS
ncbi:helix-turn-helix domain-containing protein (plasmid) [Bacillus sp. 31A1R]|uniref:Helix-turn-helix domain-containing protein n=1 Tax=Robertmurraya mangrovi TaxID=3098077 RepID=A0ABU5IVI5_9BACI|nr:helix-turn-helix domain-containing protein [Bacillus sp. 31A1R]MDZ5471167.1 helix-turn-helix domain-containing protein [Bacillus sp. 31A1R]